MNNEVESYPGELKELRAVVDAARKFVETEKSADFDFAAQDSAYCEMESALNTLDKGKGCTEHGDNLLHVPDGERHNYNQCQTCGGYYDKGKDDG